MNDLRRESRRLNAENSACKARIAEIEASLAKLATSTPDSQASPIIISIATKAAEHQKLLSATLLENAALKKAAAEKEIENAQLTLQLRKLRRKVQTSAAVEGQLRAKDREIADLKALLRESQNAQKGATPHERGATWDGRGDGSESEGEVKKAPDDQEFISMRDENAALKLEIEYLRPKCQELANCLAGAAAPARAIAAPAREEVPPDLRNRFFRRANDFLMKITLFESKVETELDGLDIRMGKLRTAYRQVKLLQKRKYPIGQATPGGDDFQAGSLTLGRQPRVCEGARIPLHKASHTHQAHGRPGRPQALHDRRRDPE
jgi:regulator of replication initiation timing